MLFLARRLMGAPGCLLIRYIMNRHELWQTWAHTEHLKSFLCSGGCHVIQAVIVFGFPRESPDDIENGDCSSVTASVGTEHGHVTTLHLFQAFKLGHSFVTWQQISLLLNTAIFFHIEFLNWVFEIHVFSELYGNRDGFTAGYLEEALALMQKTLGNSKKADG